MIQDNYMIIRGEDFKTFNGFVKVLRENYCIHVTCIDIQDTSVDPIQKYPILSSGFIPQSDFQRKHQVLLKRKRDIRHTVFKLVQEGKLPESIKLL